MTNVTNVNDKHDKHDKHEKHDKHDKHDKHEKHEKHDNHCHVWARDARSVETTCCSVGYSLAQAVGALVRPGC